MSADNLIIRPATPADTQSVKHCVELAYTPYISVIGKKPGPMLDDYAEVIQKHSTFVAEYQGEVVGILVLIITPQGILLDNVAVNPDCQGKGFGGQLVHFAEQQALNMGFSHLQLYTHQLMEDNYRAYLRLGYIEIDRREEKGFARIYMSKRLS